ncbi:ABC transporter ATP-binding protein [Paenibacillus sp. Marseille-Q4541]|uniref:ABC transporter ATP-binding protein n=1 Tax=Paenibacillus sp. Marseille-Q4541 TaxID=2831522 RepID=UPI001BA60440|nr:ABC transporter ATP-binding protein [Paenibacillus sp. Marseille-Q4541]
MIRLENVCKSFGEKHVISDVSLQIEQGECAVLMGHNGSGKSTLLRLLAGLIYPTQGRILRQAAQGKEKSFNRETGYAIDRLPWVHFTAEEYLLAMGYIQGLDKKTILTQTNTWFELFGLMEDRNQPLASYSKGMKQKVNVMQSLLGNPELVLLDEPLSGLDRKSQKQLIQLLFEHKKRGTTLVCASHETLIIQELADNVVELQRGNLMRIVNSEEIVTEDSRVVVQVINLSEAMLKNLTTYEGVIELSAQTIRETTEVTIIIHANHSDRLLSLMLADGGSIQDVSRETEESSISKEVK